MKRSVAALAAALLFAGSVLAQETPKPAAEMAQLNGFAGNWACEGNAPASPFGPAHKTRSTTQGRLDLDGHWVVGTVKEAKTAENPHPLSGMYHMTYDSSAKSFVLIWVDNFGSWATTTSPGWQGNTMVFTGDQTMMGQKAKSRDTFIKKSDTEWGHRFEMDTRGQWDLIVEETCRKK